MSNITTAEMRALSGGWDPANGQWIHRGLDLSKPDQITPEEIDAFKAHYAAQFGIADPGLDWWIDADAEVLKRYRLFCSLTLRVEPAVTGGGTLGFYMLNGYVRGVGYVIRSFQQDGISKAQMLEIIAMAFVHAGPRGMQILYQAIEGVEFDESPEPAARFPAGWAPDNAAFQSGIDHSTPYLLEGEREKIEAWYRATIGEVPAWVTFLGKHRPLLLKTHRSRMENMLKALPKQMWPSYFLYYNVMTRCPEGIRENVLLGKAWGVSKSDTLDVIGNALVYGQMEGASMVQNAAGDIFDAWED
jgi:hypothetical protein